MTDISLSIGIDIGGTNTNVGIVNKKGQILSKKSFFTKEFQTYETYLNELCRNIKIITDEFKVSNIVGIGVGAPNGNFYTGTIEFAPNLIWGKDIVPLKADIEKRTGLITTLTNDANAAALGEMMYGAAKGMNDFIVVTLGTGVGSGFVSNGKMIYGHDGFAGEIGHMIAVRDGRMCGCGRNGCLETYASATGIVKTAYEFLNKENNSSLNKVENITSKDIFLAAEQGDKLALEIFDYTGKILGQSLADVVAITSPKAIILFGGLALASHFIFEPTKKYMEQNMLRIFQNKVLLLPSELHETDAAVLGASALVW
jgi:glucokinase